MAEGIRISQDGQRRVTHGGAQRITERAVMLGASMTAAPVMGSVQFTRVRSLGAVMTAAPSASALIHGKVTMGASLTTTGTAFACALRARRGMGAGIAAVTQIYPGIGRTRPLCVQMDAQGAADLNLTRQRSIGGAMAAGGSVQFAVIKRASAGAALSTTPLMQAGADVPLQRRRNVSAALSTAPVVLPIGLRKRAFVSTHMTVVPTVTFGRDETGIYRILEDDQPRTTQGGNRRLIEESFTWGHIIVVHPPFKIFSHAGGRWYVLKPFAKEASNWQLPQGISVHWQGGWRDVKSSS